MRYLTLFVLLSLSTSLSAYEQRYEIGPKNIEFTYRPTELPEAKCEHAIENKPSGDWKVLCPFYNQVKEFSVHLLVKKFAQNSSSAHLYQILYWVSNRIPGAKTSEFTGSTFNFYLKNDSELSKFIIGQHVDNAYADLQVRFIPN